MLAFEKRSLLLERSLDACPKCGSRNFDYLGQDQFQCVVCHKKIALTTVAVTGQDESLASDKKLAANS